MWSVAVVVWKTAMKTRKKNKKMKEKGSWRFDILRLQTELLNCGWMIPKNSPLGSIYTNLFT